MPRSQHWATTDTGSRRCSLRRPLQQSGSAPVLHTGALTPCRTVRPGPMPYLPAPRSCGRRTTGPPAPALGAARGAGSRCVRQWKTTSRCHRPPQQWPGTSALHSGVSSAQTGRQERAGCLINVDHDGAGAAGQRHTVEHPAECILPNPASPDISRNSSNISASVVTSSAFLCSTRTNTVS